MKRVCDACWYHLRPTECAPNTYNLGNCDMCGDYAFVYRVSTREIEEWAKGDQVQSLLSTDYVSAKTGLII